MEEIKKRAEGGKEGRNWSDVDECITDIFVHVETIFLMFNVVFKEAFLEGRYLCYPISLLFVK